MEMEATGAPQNHHHTLNQQVGSITTKGTGIHYKRGLSDRRIDIKYGVFSTPSFKVLISLRFIFKSATCPCNPLLNKHLFMLSLFG